MKEKWCSGCNALISIEKFYKRSNGGYVSICIYHDKLFRKNKREKLKKENNILTNKEKKEFKLEQMAEGKFKCVNCSKIGGFDDFYKDCRGYSSTCKDCRTIKRSKMPKVTKKIDKKYLFLQKN